MDSTAFTANEPPAGKLAKGSARVTSSRTGEDNELIRTAAKVTRDLNAPRPAIYWADFLASIIVGYGALLGAIGSAKIGLAVAFGIIAILALYRAGSFIHELTHVRRNALPWFHFAWNALFGVPMLIPSFMYEGVHSMHHRTKKYGTKEDPEYLPLALMKPWSVPLFVVAASLAPIALLVRYAVLSPLSAIIPPLRKIVVERYSGLVINPDFRRKPPEGDLKRQWLACEIAASIWAVSLLAMIAMNVIPLRAFLIFLAVMSGSVVLNQIRTLVAHLWENDGEEMSVTAQYLDSVNVPPPGTLPALWAPVGLRYHGLHHLLPGVPYHSLGEAHRRISNALPKESNFYRSNHGSLSRLVIGLVRGSAGRA
ncbi:fatty acid desaturase family protein [Parasphingorhabdus halotolerans]|uniref:Fatty acid desaturase n=1 Tax=Parasphingorhabdus halotolerans TaxID=2725558 RepID=A0A6H2DME8_9SPHN|nr:fatty acid desaturase [Parasphingorhabdus halotolerans]QJB69307.1 fatty acid desaturase [Parasphingorhabdus halotolerans]